MGSVMAGSEVEGGVPGLRPGHGPMESGGTGLVAAHAGVTSEPVSGAVGVGEGFSGPAGSLGLGQAYLDMQQSGGPSPSLVAMLAAGTDGAGCYSGGGSMPAHGKQGSGAQAGTLGVHDANKQTLHSDDAGAGIMASSRRGSMVGAFIFGPVIVHLKGCCLDAVLSCDAAGSVWCVHVAIVLVRVHLALDAHHVMLHPLCVLCDTEAWGVRLIVRVCTYFPHT